MQKNRDVLRQVGGLAVALLVCIAVMLAVYALLAMRAAITHAEMRVRRISIQYAMRAVGR